jgi:hypothetical protein
MRTTSLFLAVVATVAPAHAYKVCIKHVSTESARHPTCVFMLCFSDDPKSCQLQLSLHHHCMPHSTPFLVQCNHQSHDAHAHTLQFMAIGDWGASYESNDCAGTLMVQQKADATAMVGGWCLRDTLHHSQSLPMCALPKNAHLYNMHGPCNGVCV